MSIQKAEADIWKDLHVKGLIAPDDKEARAEKIAKRQMAVNAFGLPMTSAETKINAIAVKLAKRDGISIERATDKAWRENASLYGEYLTEFNDEKFQEKVTKAAMEEDIQSRVNPFEDDEDDEDEEDDDGEDETDTSRKSNKCKCGKVAKASTKFCPTAAPSCN